MIFNEHLIKPDKTCFTYSKYIPQILIIGERGIIDIAKQTKHVYDNYLFCSLNIDHIEDVTSEWQFKQRKSVIKNIYIILMLHLHSFTFFISWPCIADNRVRTIFHYRRQYGCLNWVSRVFFFLHYNSF